jgi:hypothetical protein
MHVLALTNFPAAGSVIVTPVRLWNYGSARKDAASSAAATPGRWDDQLTCRCPYCGVIFVPPIPCIEVGVEGAQVVRGRRCLPESAYADPRLLVSCSHCGAALKMNPFVVDNSI